MVISDTGWSTGSWVLMSLVMVAVWGAVIALIVLLVRSAHREPPRRIPDGDAARRILDERFARGEINEDEYVHRRQLMRSA